MPKVSIGLPVYNGGRFVGPAIEGLLAQTFTDFELWVVDNASTDDTGEICRALAARDPRVHYHRNETNIGGGPNWNRAFELASAGPYFKWAAHDDLHAPTFLERCVTALDADEQAVLAFTGARFVDREGNTLRLRKLELPLASPDPQVRFEALLPSYDCLEIFGVIRRRALFRSPAMGLHYDGDGVLLAQLALVGSFIEVPEVLFANRRHGTQAGTRYDGDARAWSVWWDPENAHRRVFPNWRRQRELWESLVRAPIPMRDRLRCARSLARWTRWRRDKLYEDVAFHVKEILRPPGRSER
jgi:glycosyltransferase involved in cell wall biosynthesis